MSPASIGELFMAFTRMGLSGFGGVLPWAQRVLVDQRGWLDQKEFVALLAFAQLLPGPNVCNLAIMVGDRWFGWRGAVAALSGLMLVPACVVLAIVIVYDQFAQVPWVQRAVTGMAAVAAGLMLATGVRLARAMADRWRWLAFGALAFAGVAVLRLPLLWVLGGLAPVAVLLALRVASAPERGR